eukprot:6194516-Pleurochrysis_carterae.AAC.6
MRPPHLALALGAERQRQAGAAIFALRADLSLGPSQPVAFSLTTAAYTRVDGNIPQSRLCLRGWPG